MGNVCVSFSGCDSSWFSLPNLGLGSRRQQTLHWCSCLLTSHQEALGAASPGEAGCPLGVPTLLFCSRSLSSPNQLSHGIFVSTLLLWDCHNRWRGGDRRIQLEHVTSALYGRGPLGAGVASQVPRDGRGGRGNGSDFILGGCRNVSLVCFTGCFLLLLSGIVPYLTVWRIWL